MASYAFPNGQQLSGKYRPNFGGWQPQLYCWKQWTNSSGLTAFVPENSQAERISVNNGMQNAPGLSRQLGRFGRADGYVIVVSTPIAVYPYCISPQYAGNPGGAPGCPGGTNDVYGSMFDSQQCGIATSASNPFYNAGLGGCYVFESGNSETSGGGWNNYLCPGGFFTTFQVRYCALPNANRAACWENCS